LASIDKDFKVKNGLIVGNSTNLVNYTSASPSNPFVGQLWIDSSNNLQNVWSGSAWVTILGTASGTPLNIPNTLVSRSASGTFSVGALDLDITASPGLAVGRFQWNQDFGTPEVGLIGGNITAHIGQHIHAYVKNDEGSPLVKGDVVYLYGASGDRASVRKAINTTEAGSSKTLGVVAEAIDTNQNGFVTAFGVVDGLNLSTYSPGDVLWLSASAGKFTNIKPSAPSNLVFIGVVARANSGNGQLFVNVQNGYELEELHDVAITNAADNDVISYNAAASGWFNQNLATAITEVDGSGSGIDADLLDGQHGSYYAPINSPTFTGSVNAPEPTTASNVATKNYVDNAISNGGVVLSSASAYPPSAAEYTLFFNTIEERVAVRVGSVWKELAFVTDTPITGGDSGTLVFAGSVDGGDSSTTFFTNNYDGGES
jgi:hypothetical protein